MVTDGLPNRCSSRLNDNTLDWVLQLIRGGLTHQTADLSDIGLGVELNKDPSCIGQGWQECVCACERDRENVCMCERL